MYIVLVLCHWRSSVAKKSQGFTLRMLKNRKIFLNGCYGHLNSEIMDPILEASAVSEQVENYIKIGFVCVQDNPNSRPSMDQVVLCWQRIMAIWILGYSKYLRKQHKFSAMNLKQKSY